MTEDGFIDFARCAARRVAQNNGRIGHLVLTQENAKSEATVREPEMRTAFQQEADSRHQLYGIEVPTFYRYRFSGKGYRRALTDFALLNSTIPNVLRDVLVEFKAGQPHGEDITDDFLDSHTEDNGSNVSSDAANYPTIRKDLHKLFAEPVVYGRCMLHVCHAENTGTVPALIAKYNIATVRAIHDAEETIQRNPHIIREGSAEGGGWIILLILTIRQRGAKGVSHGSSLYLCEWQNDQWKFAIDSSFP